VGRGLLGRVHRLLAYLNQPDLLVDLDHLRSAMNHVGEQHESDYLDGTVTNAYPTERTLTTSYRSRVSTGGPARARCGYDLLERK